VSRALRKVKDRQTTKSYARRQRPRRVPPTSVSALPAATLANQDFAIACLVAGVAGWAFGFIIAPWHMP
jgi:hypothetical protein